MINVYEKNPARIHIYDPIGNKIIRTFVLIGSAPTAVQQAVVKRQTSMLKSFYGTNYAEKLMIKRGKSGGKESIGEKSMDQEGLSPDCMVVDQQQPQTLMNYRSKMFSRRPWMLGGEDQLDNPHARRTELLRVGGIYPDHRMDPDITEFFANETALEQETDGGESSLINWRRRRGTQSAWKLGGALGKDAAPIEEPAADYESISLSAEEINLVDAEKPLVTAADIADDKIYTEFTAGVEYVRDVVVYPEDNFAELRDKIYLATGVPAYRQHLFYGDGITLYHLYANGLVDTDIRKIKHIPAEWQILGIPVDRALYEIAEDIRIEAYVTFNLIGGISYFFIVDINQFIDKIKTQLAGILADTYQSDMFYFGFVIKYWPHITKEVFVDLISNEKILYQKYPDLAPQPAGLKQKYAAERKIIDEIYNVKADQNITIAITKAVAVIESAGATVNIRNLFDRLHVSKCMPEIHAYVMPPYIKKYEQRQYLLRKVLTQIDVAVPFPGVGEPKFHSGIVIALNMRKSDQDTLGDAIIATTKVKQANPQSIKSASVVESEQSKYMFISIQPDGKYFVRTIWNEEDGITFEKLLATMKKLTDDFIDRINNMGRYVFPLGGKLNSITPSSLTYSTLNVSLYWKRILSETTFKQLQEPLDEYIRAGLIEPKGLSSRTEYSLFFKKGMHDFDPHRIERILLATATITTPNYYLYLTNNIIKNKWVQLYTGRTFRVLHRTADIRFELIDCTEEEFKIFQRYMAGFIARIAKIKDRPTDIVAAPRKIKRLKKLKEVDPELYNLKKFGSKKLYSILCQNPKQPFIYTDAEYDAMTKAQRSVLTQYWNFTKQTPAWYNCPKKYPNLSFRVDVHPRGYCLPCCKIGEKVEDTKREEIDRKCLADHIYSPPTDEQRELHHTIKYGKDLEAGRAMRLPEVLVNIFENIEKAGAEDLQQYIYGVAQNFPSAKNVGAIYALAAGKNLTIAALVNKYIKYVRERFTHLLGGSIINYFDDAKSLEYSMRQIFIAGQIMSTSFPRWNDLFLDIAEKVDDLYTIIFDDNDGQMQLRASDRLGDIFVSKYGSPRFNLMVKIRADYHPIYEFTADFYKTGAIAKKEYSLSDPLIQYLGAMITGAKKESTPVWTYRALKTHLPAGAKLIVKYMNVHSGCYGVDVSYRGVILYVPVIAAGESRDEIPVRYDPVKHPRGTPRALENFISAIKIKGVELKTGRSIIYNNKIIAIELLANDIPLYAYVAAGVITSSASDNLVIHYDPLQVNRAIIDNKSPVIDNRTKLLSKALFTNYEYQLFMLSFANFIEADRNKEVRKTLSEDIKRVKIQGRGDLFRVIDKNLIGDDSTMMKHKVILSINEHGLKPEIIREELLQYIKNSVFEFDKLTLNKLKKIRSRDEFHNELKKIVAEFAVGGAPTAGKSFTMPNVFLPCRWADEDYCSGDKLIVKDLETLVSLLADDLRNPLKERFLLGGLFTDNIIEFFKFDTHEFETVLISKIER